MMSKADRARQIVVEVWDEMGFDPKLFASSIEDVLAGKWDHRAPVRIALKALGEAA